MEIFDVFSMNGIENNPAAGEFFLENVILKVSQTHFSKDFKGGCEVPCEEAINLGNNATVFQTEG